MANEDAPYEEILNNANEILVTIGLSTQALINNSDDLFTVQEFIKGKLGGNERDAETIMRLAKRMAEGKNPQREIEKLRKKVTIIPEMPTSSVLPNVPTIEVPTSSALPNVQTINEKPPFFRRTALARNRLPKSGGHFAKWSIGTIFRGPRNRKK